ncbi:MAG: GDYXXLXY domain-containing protein [Elainellaceae cyanobacterium]
MTDLAQKPAQNSAQTRPTWIGGLTRWPFWLPLVLQLALILAAPARSTYTITTGQSVLLETAPVDPYDLLRGYYVTLNYQISQPVVLNGLPGWDELDAAPYRNRGLPVYVVLEGPETADAPWRPVRVSRDRPQVDTNQVALRGEYRRGRLIYGLERYYIPEEQRVEINERINQIQRSQPDSYLVEVKVDGQGQSVPVSLWIGDENYRF